jgi:beta-galactosidase
MKKLTVILLFCLAGISLTAQTNFQRNILFDSDWKFFKGGIQGAEKPGFNDSDWRKLDLPHDWSIEDLPGTQSPFNANAVGQTGAGFTEGGIGWYRKSFIIPEGDKEKTIQLQFDGVYMNAEIWLNGQMVGKHAYGYTTFLFDISDKILVGKENILAVKVQNLGENSRWYSGSGIYRHVWLNILNPVHFSQWGNFISTPEITADKSRVNIKTNITNTFEKAVSVEIKTILLNAQNHVVGTTRVLKQINSKSSIEVEQDAKVLKPELWSTDSPALYKAVVELYLGEQMIDRNISKFGIRTIRFDATNGFQLNGKTIKLKGGCVHHDNGPLGAKAYDRAEFRKVELHKASGYNALRSAHNPPSTALLEACDSLGMLFIDEAFDMWQVGKNAFDYHLYFEANWKKDIESIVLRDRNHPSIILWSIGNEIPDMDNPETVEVAKMLSDYVRKLDASRPVTAAVNGMSDKKDAFIATLDVTGYNYAPERYVSDHQRKPDRVMVATESSPMLAFKYWMGVNDNPWVVGDFVWTSFDYIGEASIGWLGYWPKGSFFPWNLAFCGDIDICGWKRPQSYYRDALWQNPKALSIFVKSPTPSFELNPNKEEWSQWDWHDVLADWNWSGFENKPLEVNIYSSCEQVELFLNNKSLGKKPISRATEFMAKWEVPYQAGELKAIGYRGKKQINTAILQTTGEPTQIKLSVDRSKIKADSQDLCYITVELLDQNGVRNPKAENLMKFEIDGPGGIVGVANANPVSLESYQLPQRKAWQGRCLVIVKSDDQKGKIVLKASSAGLTSSTIVLQVD